MLAGDIEEFLEFGYAEFGSGCESSSDLFLDSFDGFPVIYEIIREPDQYFLLNHPEEYAARFFGISLN